MGRSYLRFRSDFIERASSRVQRVSKPISKILGQFTPRKNSSAWKRIGGLFFILLSGVLGRWAYQLAEKKGEENLEQRYIPSIQTSWQILAKQGWQRVEGNSKLRSVLTPLSFSSEHLGAFWISQDRNWLIFYPKDIESGEQPQFYCQDCKTVPKDMKILGKGWMGLERALKISQRTQFGGQKSSKDHRFKDFRDPREIRY